MGIKQIIIRKQMQQRDFTETNVDSLAIAIGNAHGVYVETPHLDIQRLEKLMLLQMFHLVLHGGSGIPHDQLEIAFRKGINKFNVGTEFLSVYYDAVKEYVHMMEGNDKPLKMLEVPEFVQTRLCEYLEEKMKLSSSDLINIESVRSESMIAEKLGTSGFFVNMDEIFSCPCIGLARRMGYNILRECGIVGG